MKLPIALGVALAALTVAGAAAQSSSRHVVISRSGASNANLDANEDGWITRAEASAAYEQIFNDLDSNTDGKLDDSDHRQRIHVTGNAPAVHIFRNGDGDRRDVRVVTGDLSAEDEARIEAQVATAMARAEAHVERSDRDRIRAVRHAERAERMADEAERRAERIEREVERADRDGERHVDRHVVIIRTNGEDGASWTSLEGGDVDLVAPVPPIPPAPPVGPFMLLIANSEEADLNGDGALSLEEFRNQHLRFFDASDANGDGRVRFEEPPAPPQPPAPPAPPEPPRRR